MKIWLDAHLSPALSKFIRVNFETECYHVRELGLRDSSDKEIFQAAREARAIVMTKDSDFLELLVRFGPPPHVIWITIGNTSNEKMRAVLNEQLRNAFTLISSGERIVEITGR